MLATYWPQTILLHDHMDGSRPLLAILPELHRLSGAEYPFDQWAGHHEQVIKWFGNPLKGDIVKKFSVTTGVMQDIDTLYLAAKTYTRIRANQGFRYCEATIAPQYHTFAGLAVQEVIHALVRGIMGAERDNPAIEVNLLLGIGREVDPEIAVRYVEMFSECNKDVRPYLAGINLVCDEVKNPPEKHIKMFRRAKQLGWKTACHVSEWVHDPDTQEPDLFRDLSQLLKNIRTAVFNLEVDRLEHAIALPYDTELIEFVRTRKIGVAGCPGSYLCSELLPNNDVGVLKLREMLNGGILYSLGPDDDLFMATLDEVFQVCNDKYRFTEEEKRKLLLNPWLSRFGNRKQHNVPTA